MPYKPIAGKDARVTVGGTNYNFRSWRMMLGADEIDASGFENGQWEYVIAGLFRAPIQLAGLYDAGNQPEALLLIPDQEVTLKLYISKTLALYLEGPALVLDTPLGSDVRGAATFDVALKARGPWRLPDGQQLGETPEEP